MSRSGSPRAIKVFECLYSLGDQRPDLATIRDRTIVVPIQEWQTAYALTRAREEAEQQEGMARNIREFEANKAAIRSGSHLGWLSWLARVYFGDFMDSDGSATPVERLEQALGPQRTEVAIEGLMAVPQRTDIPSLDEVARMAAEHQSHQWWHAILAGLDESWKQSQSLQEWSDGLLRVALAIDLVSPTFEHEGSTTRQTRRDWKEAAFKSRPAIVRDAYLAVANAGLGRGNQHVDGLRELLTHEAFAPFRREITFQFLRAFPNASPYHLQELLESASAITEARSKLISLARDAVHGSVQLNDSNRDIWLVSAYLLSPQEFEDGVASRATTGPEIVWLARHGAFQRKRFRASTGPEHWTT